MPGRRLSRARLSHRLSPLALGPRLLAVLQVYSASSARGYSRVPQLLTHPKPPSPLAVLDLSWTSQMGTYQEDQVMVRMPALHPHPMPLTLKVSPGEVVLSVLLAKTKAIYSTFLILRVRLSSTFPSAYHTRCGTQLKGPMLTKRGHGCFRLGLLCVSQLLSYLGREGFCTQD